MCGISGIYGYQNDHHLIKGMIETIRHRGPDGIGLFNDEQTALAHVRLAIVDPHPTGAQPMKSIDERYVLIYNGEIYNHQDLRQQLKQFDIQFKGSSDTETLLYLLIHFGPDILPQLNGIFAFAFYDTQKQELLLARDHMGVKPLYYTRKNGRFFFSSEIKSLFIDQNICNPEVNHEDVLEFLMFHFISGERTAFRDVFQLLPGHMLVINKDSFTTSCFWEQPLIPIVSTATEDELIASCLELSKAAVNRQLMSDVPLGIMLSGGLDSGTVAAFSQQSATTMQGYCYYDETNGYDETAFAKQMATQFNINLNLVQIKEQELPNLLETVTWHFDEPVPRPHNLAAYAVSKAAAHDGIKVLLTGEGGDEIFCGYTRYKEITEKYSADHDPSHIIFGHNRVALTAIEKFYSKRSFTNNYRFWVPYTYRNLDAINQQLISDQKTFLIHFLQRSDRMGMAVGLENRVPLLDIELVNFMNRIPGEQKMKNGELKYIQKQMLKGILSDEIIYQKKQPFDMPIETYLQRGVLNEYMKDLLLSDARCSYLFDKKGMATLINDMTDKKPNAWKMVWLLMCFEVWLRKFNVSI
jgi:asparagine synthase (glutamine-hydrolysing)